MITSSKRTLIKGALFGGGIEGNEQLRATAGVVLILLLAALGVTILQIRVARGRAQW